MMAEAHAAVADAAWLGEHPIVQFFVGVVVLVAGLSMWLRGERTTNQKGPTGGVQMYFDGPLADILKQLVRLAEAAGEVPEAARLVMAMRENIRTELERIERELRANIDALGKEIDLSRHRIMDDLQKRIVPSFEEDVRLLDERLRRVEQDTSWLKGQREASPRTR